MLSIPSPLDRATGQAIRKVRWPHAATADSAKTEAGFISASDGVRLFYQQAGSGNRTIIIPGRLFLFEHLKPITPQVWMDGNNCRHLGNRSGPDRCLWELSRNHVPAFSPSADYPGRIAEPRQRDHEGARHFSRHLASGAFGAASRQFRIAQHWVKIAATTSGEFLGVSSSLR